MILTNTQLLQVHKHIITHNYHLKGIQLVSSGHSAADTID